MTNMITNHDFNLFLLWCSERNLIGSVTLTHCNGGFITLVEVDIAGSMTSITNFGDASSPCKTFKEAFDKLKTIMEKNNEQQTNY